MSWDLGLGDFPSLKVPLIMVLWHCHQALTFVTLPSVRGRTADRVLSFIHCLGNIKAISLSLCLLSFCLEWKQTSNINWCGTVIFASSCFNSWQVGLFKATQQRRTWQRKGMCVLKAWYLNEGRSRQVRGLLLIENESRSGWGCALSSILCVLETDGSGKG